MKEEDVIGTTVRSVELIGGGTGGTLLEFSDDVADPLRESEENGCDANRESSW